MRYVITQQMWRAARRILALLALLLLLLGSTGAAIIAQGGRDEAQRADIAVILVDGPPLAAAARTDRAIALYLQGRVSQLVVVGRDPIAAQTILLNRGVQSLKLAALQAPDQAGQLAQLQATLNGQRSQDVALLAEPVEMLRLLKMAQDRGLRLMPMPTSNAAEIDLGAVVDETVQYLRYALGWESP